MKRILLLTALTIATALALSAATAVGSAKIYINPGHGSWGPNDRPMATIPYPMLSSTGRPDTCGFYESNTNLWKALRLYDALVDLGCKKSNLKMSRTKNGPYPYVSGASDQNKYNRNLSVICEEVDTWGADMFFSIHSDAATEGSTANRSLYIFRGKDNNNYVAGSQAMAQALWNYAYVGTNGIDYASSTSTNIRGDISFYGSSSTRYGSKGNYTGYLGVLKHGIPGFLAEGYCHTYQPARHRALNKDYCGQEGIRYARGIASYFGWTPDSKGYIMGFVKDKSKSVSNSLYTYKSGTRAGDEYWPVMGAHVYLYKDGTKVATYLTDNNYNGVFVFDRLAPGSYTIIVKASGYKDYTQDVTVTANATTYPGIYLTAGQGTDPDDDPDVPTPTPTEKIKGIFAYDLSLVKGDNNSYTFNYSANSDAISGRIIFTDSISGATLGSIALADVKQGSNSITVTNDQLPTDAGEDQVMNWSVELTGKPIEAITRLNDDNSSFDYTRASVAVDNSPESDFLGSVYVSDRKTRNASKTNADNRDNGIYRYNALWQRENSTPYTGNMAWDNNYRIATDYHGTLYIPDYGDNHSGLFIADPHKMSDTWQNFFAGSRLLSGATAGLITNGDVNTGSSAPSASIYGSGADTKLYVSLEDMDEAIHRYDLGALIDADGNLPAKWYTAPEKINNTPMHYKSGTLNSNTYAIAQSDGGVWVSQNEYSSMGYTMAPLRFVTADGSSYRDFTSALAQNLDGCAGGGFVLSPDERQLIIADKNGDLQFYNIDRSGALPSLTWVKSFTPDVKDNYSATGNLGGQVYNGIYQLAFDRGGNLYVAGRSLGIYSIPTDNNTSVTPAKRTSTLIKGEVVIPQPDPYTIKKDIDSYADTQNIALVSNWVRSVKEEYNNIVFDEDGIKNRGFAVAGDKVLITARSENSTAADLSLIVLDRATGETTGTIQLADEAKVELYGNNDVMLDAAGNIVISNLTLDVSSVPLQLFTVDTISGAVTRVASLVKANAGTARVDHCSVLGNVASGNFTVMAVQANGKNLISWTVENGEVTKSHVVEAQAFYPAAATGFGIAPRIWAVDATHAIVSGGSTHPALYDVTTGALDDSFAANADIAPAGLYANGFAAFEMAGKHYMVYPTDDFRSSTGNRWTIAANDSGTDFAGFSKLFEFPTRGLGAVNSQTWGAPVRVSVADDNRSAEIVVYVPGEGLASYTLTDLNEPVEPDYVIKKDIDSYEPNLDLTLASNWVRSVKAEYDNFSFDDSGIRNRGFAVTPDVVYITGRSANSTDADIYLDRLDRATGRSLDRLPLAADAKVPYYPANDILLDAAGNLVLANLSLNLATTPLRLFAVDSISGNVTPVAVVGAGDAIRVDHCAVVGDVASGNFTILAASANAGKLLSWHITDGAVADTLVVDAQAFYPASATAFGIAPRVSAVDHSHAWVSGSSTHPTLYDFNTGAIDDSFAANTAIEPAGINANGAADFTFARHRFFIYPSEDHLSADGNKWKLAIGETGATLEGMTTAFEFPARALGKVHSQTWGAPAIALPNADGKSADIFVFVPGEGVASYTLTYTAPLFSKFDVNEDGVVNVGDVATLYSIILGADLTFERNADVNDDNTVNVGDVASIYTAILAGN